MENGQIISRLYREGRLEKNEYEKLISTRTQEDSRLLFSLADEVRQKHFGRAVYFRGLIEFTSFCRNDCYYCGLRCSNRKAERYRLSEEEILSCCEKGYSLGIRSFVLQGGEDGYFDDEKICSAVREIKKRFPECAVTLSIGEKSRESYEAFYRAGADRYLLRHETADSGHYRRLHPKGLSPENRKRCLYDLKETGYQVGAGFMVGSPYQTAASLAEDMMFLQELRPHMVGIGPFIPHADTPFCNEKSGTAELTVFMLGLARLALPEVLLPATTALATIDEGGREKAFRAGANVLMPNLTPETVRAKYMLYDNKLCTGSEAAEGISRLKEAVKRAGYYVEESRGDAPGFKQKHEKED